MCRGCRGTRLDPVFHMDPMPLAGAFAKTREEALAATKYPLTWLLCADCGLVNVEPDIPDEVIYSTYSYAASTVPALVRHHAEFAKTLTQRYTEPVRILEIGGNDGVLLNQLPATWDRWNVDPSDVALQSWPGYGWELINKPFAADLLPGSGTFDVVTSSNAFAHFSDIAGALEGVARVLRPGGEFWIEVHDLQATMDRNQWDTAYTEHKCEWSWQALRRNLEARGLRVKMFWEMPLHGGLLRALCVKEQPDPPSRRGGWFPDDFASLQRAYDLRSPVKADAAYGAAARATVYLNQCETGAQYVVDGSPLRANHYVPGVGIPVIGPDSFDIARPTRTLITAWNHADDIKARHPGYTGRWVTAW